MFVLERSFFVILAFALSVCEDSGTNSGDCAPNYDAGTNNTEPQRSQEPCCSVPNIFPGLKESAEKCAEDVPHLKGNGAKSSAIIKHLKMIRRIAEENTKQKVPLNSRDSIMCNMNECLFNTSGYLKPDGMLNEQFITERVKDSFGNDTKLSFATFEIIIKKCISAANEMNSQSKDTCKPGYYEYLMCLTREVFLNCPAESWTNDESCAKIKERIEKCPNLPEISLVRFND